ncbi:LOW QUALITY PROTEIN: HERV-H LTR-associating protein 2, partial [Thomomys bottae]
SSYECTIENALLKQTWIGQWILKVKIVRSLFPPNQNFSVTRSRMENWNSSILACYWRSS